MKQFTARASSTVGKIREGWLLGLAVPVLLLGFADACLAGCLDCHLVKEEVLASLSLHEPYGEKDCLACHEDHGEDGRLVLAGRGNRLCAGCHDPREEAFVIRHRGLPVAGIECLSCHLPHASDRIALLRQDIHRPLASGECRDCHEEEGGMAAGSTPLLCFRCHESRSFRGVTEHEPAASGDCTGCHDPHGGPHGSLLAGSYPAERYAAFDEGRYGLCLSCHDESAFTEEGPGAETGFKDGERNLHYLHVVRRAVSSAGVVVREGMTCRNCHLPHASLSPRLVRETLDCGEGVPCLRLAYFVHGGVGTCKGGCHKSASYSSEGAETAGVHVSPVAGASLPQPVVPDSPCLGCHQGDWQRFQKHCVHDPVRKKRCEGCHLDHGDEFDLKLLSPGERLCTGCHAGKEEALVEAHGGLDVTGSRCLRCHDPHASENRGLLPAVSHEPFGDCSCTDCHDSPDGTWPIGRPVDEVCADCHDCDVEEEYLHEAVRKESCVACHDPHAGASDELLAAGPRDLCCGCHQPGDLGRKFVHGPVREGDCLACHSAHGDERRHLLAGRGNQLCAGCHDTGEETFVGRHRGLPVAGIECLSCHLPHASDKIALLRRDIHRPLAYGKCRDCHLEEGRLAAGSTALLCFRCHESRLFRGVTEHEPAASGDCTGCHDPHGGPRGSLLAESYPLERYAAFDEGRYGLCLSCHDESAFTEEGPGAETGFKDGERNLHYLHVVKRVVSSAGTPVREGISCRNCHAPHASLGPHLVRETLDCGEGVPCLRLAYFVREGVGTCKGGCHKSASYSSEGAETAPVPVWPAESPPEPVPASPCVECHRDDWQRFQEACVHDPVGKKRCEECHLEHGDEKELKLLAPGEGLCTGCHAGREAALVEAHGGLDVTGSRCLRCHDPHASENPALLPAVSHKPFRDRACVSCHDPAAFSAVNHLQGEMPELCFRCHEAGLFAPWGRHRPIEGRGCGACHDVHGTRSAGQPGR